MGQQNFNWKLLQDHWILDTDSYKYSHPWQFPPKTTRMFCYGESRGGQYGSVIPFGPQYIAARYLTQRLTTEVLDAAKPIIEAHGEPFHYEGFKHIIEKHGGYLPIRIRAAKEGSVIPVKNVLFTTESTDPEVF